MSYTVVGIIPARKGSRRLPGKNLMKIGNDSLLALAVHAALSSGVIDHLVVSSDDPLVLAEARSLGVQHLHTRSDHLCEDSTETGEVLLDVVDTLRSLGDIEPDVVITLQPTSPLRRGIEVREAFLAWQEDPSRPLTTCAHPLQPVKDLVIRESNGGLIPLINKEELGAEQSIVFLDGMVYVTPLDYLMTRKMVFDLSDGVLLQVDPLRAVDIDFDFQVELARKLSH